MPVSTRLSAASVPRDPAAMPPPDTDPDTAAANTLEFSVDLTCGNCERKVGAALASHGLEDYSISVAAQKVVVVTRDRASDEVREVIEQTGKVAVLVGSGGGGSSSVKYDHRMCPMLVS